VVFETDDPHQASSTQVRSYFAVDCRQTALVRPSPVHPGALRKSRLEPIPAVSLSRCALRPPPGPTFLSFSDSIRSTQHVEETCSTVLLPAANQSRSRVRTACELAAPAFSNPSRCAESLSSSTACCVADQVGRALRSTTRLCGCYGYRAGLDALLRVLMCSRIARALHTGWPCSVILFAHFFLRLRPPFVFRTGSSHPLLG